MYAIGKLPLIHKLQGDVAQVWYADDDSAGGSASGLCEWWDRLLTSRPQFGYHPNPGITWFVVKPEHRPAAELHFQGTGINITTYGQRYLGAALGTRPLVDEFVKLLKN